MQNRYHLEELFNTADLDIKAGKIEAAVEKLQQILSEEPTFGKAYNHLGWLHETKFKDYTQAEKYYKLALEYSPDYTASYKNYAILLSTLNKYDDLKALLEKAFDIPGMDKATIYNEYGIMYEQLEQYNMAIKYYKDAAKATINDKTMKAALDSIERCNTKMNL
ncbi:tetratricopeptide repeat protein [uncultured Croceitalea sp.]|uniref:tetratricopeptide repeat protein n=1 Tax=uncultured Croceitalea sp. TaxID=1798908 RepID=UPI0033068C16